MQYYVEDHDICMQLLIMATQTHHATDMENLCRYAQQTSRLVDVIAVVQAQKGLHSSESPQLHISHYLHHRRYIFRRKVQVSCRFKVLLKQDS